MKADKPKIHFWVPYPMRVAPSQRFRVELFLHALTKEGFSIKINTFLSETAWKNLYRPGMALLKAWGTIAGFFRRVIHLFQSIQADFVFVHREATPVGPPVFEWLLVKVFRKKIIYEYDDAIWIPGGEKTGAIKKWLKATWKIKHIIRWSYKVAGGNEFLCNYARQFNDHVILIPTVVDTNTGHGKVKSDYKSNPVVVGWTGTHTTLHNLELIEDVLLDLSKEANVKILIISNKPPNWNFPFEFIQWEAATELEDLLKIDVGIMPLKQGPWFEGKCGFKLIQYHACGLPAVASPVGVNSIITLHEKTGYIAADEFQWRQSLKSLIGNTELRRTMGEAGRNHIVRHYSLHSHLLSFLSLFS